MGQIVCSVCNSTVDYFEDEKVTVLYGQCSSSDCEHHHHHDFEE
ncbi:GapA-binding peptide SR1P [Caldibacillus sp. 210928-DFI.2.22]|nr:MULTISPECIES: GapA-binding peptide SR1P [unclassified Caldibacillus]MCB7068517.1 GapA-binding peptide SR1P [Caldibacillus sp. 210928-DFI.2.22]MCB7072082.1 GapA-binding peptide SR1P [Caldibacillus sp. 210928-DFI.2.18]